MFDRLVTEAVGGGGVVKEGKGSENCTVGTVQRQWQLQYMLPEGTRAGSDRDSTFEIRRMGRKYQNAMRYEFVVRDVGSVDARRVCWVRDTRDSVSDI